MAEPSVLYPAPKPRGHSAKFCAALTETFSTGITRIEARGGYSGQGRDVLYFVVNRFQIARLRDIVHELDPTAYITISEVADIFRGDG